MDELIEKTIDAVGIPLGMRDRARENLKRKTEAEVKAIHDKAIQRQKQLKDWLAKKR